MMQSRHQLTLRTFVAPLEMLHYDARKGYIILI